MPKDKKMCHMILVESHLGRVLRSFVIQARALFLKLRAQSQKKELCIYSFNLFLFFGKHNIKVMINEIVEIGIVSAKKYMVVSDNPDAVPL